MAVARWRPNQTVTLRDAFQQLFEDAFTDGLPTQITNAFPVDIHETADTIEVDAAIPGADVGDVEVTTTNNSVMIRAEVKADREEHEGDMLRQERVTGIFQRAFTLPTEIDPNGVEARMDNGILVIRLPKAEATKPKRVEVHGNGKATAQGNGKAGSTQQAQGKAESGAQAQQKAEVGSSSR